MSKTQDLNNLIEKNAQMYANYVYRQIIFEYIKDALEIAKVTWIRLEDFEKMYWDAINAFYDKDLQEWSFTEEKLQHYNFVLKVFMENVRINLTIYDVAKIYRKHVTDDITQDIEHIIDNVKNNTR